MRKPTSSGSRMGTRKRTMDSAPRRPRERGSENWIVMKSVVMAGLRAERSGRSRSRSRCPRRRGGRGGGRGPPPGGHDERQQDADDGLVAAVGPGRPEEPFEDLGIRSRLLARTRGRGRTSRPGRFRACRPMSADRDGCTAAVGPSTSTTNTGGPAPAGRVGHPAGDPLHPELAVAREPGSVRPARAGGGGAYDSQQVGRRALPRCCWTIQPSASGSRPSRGDGPGKWEHPAALQPREPCRCLTSSQAVHGAAVRGRAGRPSGVPQRSRSLVLR